MKEPLTVDFAIANKFTLLDCVRYFMPDWPDEQCSYYVWNCTCYPFSLEKMIEQLNQQLGTGEDLTDYTKI